MKLWTFAVFVFCVAVPLQSKIEPALDYFWRPYVSELVPYDAYRANVDENCDTALYVGQAWFKEGLLPSGLYGKSNEVVATADQKLLTTTEHSRILCTKHPHLYKWIPTTTQSFDETKKECELVQGGVEHNLTMYIGRQLQDGRMMIGKIYKFPSRELVLPAGNDQNERRYTSYDILTFNCNKPCTTS